MTGFGNTARALAIGLSLQFGCQEAAAVQIQCVGNDSNLPQKEARAVLHLGQKDPKICTPEDILSNIIDIQREYQSLLAALPVGSPGGNATWGTEGGEEAQKLLEKWAKDVERHLFPSGQPVPWLAALRKKMESGQPVPELEALDWFMEFEQKNYCFPLLLAIGSVLFPDKLVEGRPELAAECAVTTGRRESFKESAVLEAFDPLWPKGV